MHAVDTNRIHPASSISSDEYVLLKERAERDLRGRRVEQEEFTLTEKEEKTK